MECKNVLERARLLYVEDEPAIRELLQETVGDEFAAFETASDGAEGLRKFLEGDYDVVVTDIEMPKMNGLDLAQQIRKKSKETPVLILSAYTEKERLFRAIDVGIVKYLVKPLTPEKLLAAVCEVLKERYALTELGYGLLYDPDTKDIVSAQGRVKLTKKEFKLLELLLRHRGRIVTLEQIEQTIWPEGGFSEDALRALIKRVRHKSSKSLIENYPGIGYKLVR